MSANASLIYNILIWTVVTPMLARMVLGFYYNFVARGRARPAAGTMTHKLHYHRAMTVVVIGYFFYCIYVFVAALPPSYYQQLGVQRGDPLEKIKTNFRQAVVAAHPDKAGGPTADSFMHLRSVYEVLSHRESRLAYENYGPEVIVKVGQSSLKSSSKPILADYCRFALNDWCVFYLITASIFLLHGFFGEAKAIIWRFLLIIAMATLDLYLLMRPMEATRLFIFDIIPTFQKIAIARHSLTYLGLIVGHFVSSVGNSEGPEGVKKSLQRLETEIVPIIAKDAQFERQTIIKSFSEEEIAANLRKRMETLSTATRPDS